MRAGDDDPLWLQMSHDEAEKLVTESRKVSKVFDLLRPPPAVGMAALRKSVYASVDSLDDVLQAPPAAWATSNLPPWPCADHSLPHACT